MTLSRRYVTRKARLRCPIDRTTRIRSFDFRCSLGRAHLPSSPIVGPSDDGLRNHVQPTGDSLPCIAHIHALCMHSFETVSRHRSEVV